MLGALSAVVSVPGQSRGCLGVTRVFSSPGLLILGEWKPSPTERPRPWQSRPAILVTEQGRETALLNTDHAPVLVDSSCEAGLGLDTGKNRGGPSKRAPPPTMRRGIRHPSSSPTRRGGRPFLEVPSILVAAREWPRPCGAMEHRGPEWVGPSPGLGSPHPAPRTTSRCRGPPTR